MLTNLNRIRAQSPCVRGWKLLLTGLGKTEADDEPLSMITVLNSNGFEHALWCLRGIAGYDKEIRLLAIWFARQVQHLMTDTRSIEALDVAERFANGQANQEQLNAAQAGARAAAAAGIQIEAAEAAEAAAWAGAEAAAASAAAAAARAAAAVVGIEAKVEARTEARNVARNAQLAQLRKVCADCEVQVAL